jgi:hypothetical protein
VSRTDFNVPNARSWRDIPQQVKPRAMSTEGRRRVAWGGVKTLAILAITSGVVWGGIEVGAALRGNPKQFSAAVEAVPVKEVVLITDGVLDQPWLLRTLGLPKKASLMELDLYALRAKLIACGQVRTATLTRNFPATLTISISERSPVARIMARMDGVSPMTVLVARDGSVFEGIGFDADMVKTLPWLDGVKLSRQDDHFVPIANMEPVADLLAKAKLEAEHLYRTWDVVSLARLQSDGEIEVRAKGIGKIHFGTTEDFFRQLARLDLLLDKARAQTDKPLREINLAIGSQVPVTFDDPALVPAASTANGARPTAAKTPSAPTFTNVQRKSKL